MLEAFENKLRHVRFRCSINLMLGWAGRILAAAGIVAVLVVLVKQLFAVDLISPLSVWVFVGGTAFWILLLWILHQPSRMQTSLVLDERLKLRERFSTTLALADSEDPFAEAARKEARQRAKRMNVAGHFPIRASRCWGYAVGAWVIAGAILLLVEPRDLLGFMRRQNEQREQVRKMEQAKAQLKEAATPVKLAVNQLGKPELAEALSKLDQIPKDAKPQDVKRQAIKALGDLSDQIKKLQSGAELQSMELMQKMLKQLRGSPDAFSQKLSQALARGNFAEASSLLEQMQKQLDEMKLTEEQRKALAEQLRNMAKQISQLAQKNSELEKELEKLGLDKKLTQMSEQQLKQALQKQGLSKEKMEQLLKKAAACRSACSRCSKLGQAMASCGSGSGLAGMDLAGLMDVMDELQATKEQLAAMQASLAEISRCMGGLGEGMCEGLGCMGPFRKGSWQGYAAGTGGPGRGYGPRGYDDSGTTADKKTKVKNKSGEGPIVASWYFKGTQVKGEARRKFSEVVQAGRDSAAEAINENEIPRKYEGAVKNYFGQLEEAGEE